VLISAFYISNSIVIVVLPQVVDRRTVARSRIASRSTTISALSFNSQIYPEARPHPTSTFSICVPVHPPARAGKRPQGKISSFPGGSEEWIGTGISGNATTRNTPRRGKNEDGEIEFLKAKLGELRRGNSRDPPLSSSHSHVHSHCRSDSQHHPHLSIQLQPQLLVFRLVRPSLCLCFWLLPDWHPIRSHPRSLRSQVNPRSLPHPSDPA
jgi:hypothetical protein